MRKPALLLLVVLVFIAFEGFAETDSCSERISLLINALPTLERRSTT
jgi:hypothetical protein